MERMSEWRFPGRSVAPGRLDRPQRGGRHFFQLVAFCVFVVFGQSACAAESVESSALPSLAGAYKGRLKIGAAIEPEQLKTGVGALLASQFSSVVAENAMKAAYIQPREGEFDFAPADTIADFAQKHGLFMRGHTLLWDPLTPDWFWRDSIGKPASREVVLARLKHHIEVVIGRYKQRVYAWDVVNEVIDVRQPNCLRDDRWFRVVGADYIDFAFRYAHAADPKARLFINDDGTARPEKLRCLELVVKGLLARGVPVHGVGHQMHMSVFEPSLAAVDDALSVFARLGLENEITEFDMSLYQRYRSESLSDTPDNLLAKQAERYQALMGVFLKHPELTAVTWWGISDADTWLNAVPGRKRSDQPLLFDKQLRPKASFWSVLRAAQ